ncbi:MAG: hypothetical protein OXB88_00190, partial [Bacteriovoracales bacterium]|nr:hypothetical protein [Bacteriovoracales bacterium]
FYEHFQKFCPDYLGIVDPKSRYEKFSPVSFDHAVLEQSHRLLFVEGKFQWTDVGTWKALEGILGPHGENTLVGSTSVSAVDSRGNIVWDDCDHVALVGVRDLVIVRHEGRLLVMDKNGPQEGMRKLYEMISKDESLR